MLLLRLPRRHTRRWLGTVDREDSDALEFSLFRLLSPNRVQEVNENFVEPIVFTDEDLRAAPEAYAITFGSGLYDDVVLSTAASEDFLVDTCGSLPPGGEERHSSPSYSELLDMVTRAVDKLGLDWEADAVQTQSQSKLDDRFLTSRAPTQSCKPLPFLVRWRRWWRLSATCGSTSWHKRKGQIFSHGWPDLQGWTVRKFSHRSGGEIQGSEAAISRFLPADSAQTQGNKAVSDDGGTLALVILTMAKVPCEKSHHLWHPLVRIGVLGLIHLLASASGKD